MKRGNTFYFRREVPFELREQLGRREFKVSLCTGYLRSAQHRATTLSDFTYRLYRSLRNGSMAELTNDQIQSLADQWLKQVLDEAEVDRIHPRSKPLSIDNVDDREDVLGMVQLEAREQLGTNNYSQVSNHVDIFLRDNPELPIEKESLEYRQLSREVLKRFVEYCRVEMKRNKGDYSDELPSSVSTSMILAQPERPQAERLSLKDAVEKYIEDKTNGPKPWSLSSQKDIPPQVRQFVEIVGKDHLIGDLTRDDVRSYREVMLKLPARRTSNPYKGKSLKQLLRMNVPEDKRLAPKTLDTRFTNIRTFLNWAELEGCVDRSKPLNAILVAPEANSTTKTRTPFSQGDLTNLFHSTEYVTDKHSKAWHYWIPILALFTGARAEELAQLHTSDIKQIDEVWVLDINEIGDKRVKTKAGKRRVPLHPFLLNDLNFLGLVRGGCGFLDRLLRWSSPTRRTSNYVQEKTFFSRVQGPSCA